LKPVFWNIYHHLSLFALDVLAKQLKKGRGPNHVLQDSEDLLSRLGSAGGEGTH